VKPDRLLGDEARGVADLGLGATKTDVCNLVLAAGTRAAAEVNADLVLVPA